MHPNFLFSLSICVLMGNFLYINRKYEVKNIWIEHLLFNIFEFLPRKSWKSWDKEEMI